MLYWCLLSVALCTVLVPLPVRADGPSFSDAGNAAISTLLNRLYSRDGTWQECNALGCPRSASDWGVDSLTYALYLRWSAGDTSVAPELAALAASAPRYGAPCAGPPGCQAWSDTPSWDAVALLRAYEAGHDPQTLDAARAAVAYVEHSSAFGGGACPGILYQMPHNANRDVKSLETEANLVKAELLLYQATGESRYIVDAAGHYDRARTAYLDPELQLYTVHVLDDGTHCVRVDHRFFASVNGDMIWDGLALEQALNRPDYGDQARATAHAVDRLLSDGRGVFVDAAGENDVAEPLVEGMFALARMPGGTFARDWIVRNAAAALSARATDGTFARYFDGPPQAESSAWQGNGGFALEIAAAALAPDRGVPAGTDWAAAAPAGGAITSLPATVRISGSGVALVGMLGRECEHQHVRVLLDGQPLVDRNGLWRNPTMPSAGSPAVVFAWRWPGTGTHVVRLESSGPLAVTLRLQAYRLP